VRRKQIDSAIKQARAAGADLITFVHAAYPRLAASFRYRLNGYSARVGVEDLSYPGRVVDLRTPSTHAD
jgi:hypothetical protein